VLTLLDARTTNATRGFALRKIVSGYGSARLILQSTSRTIAEGGELLDLTFTTHSPRAMNTVIRFDSAKIKDANAYTKNVLNLSNGIVLLSTSGIGPSSGSTMPIQFALYQNYPNPFNPTTKIRYEVAKQCRVSIKIIDILGREVATLIDGNQQPGKYETVWNGAGYPSGVYFYRLQAGSYTETKKMILLK
jgi:hypothetical protein